MAKLLAVFNLIAGAASIIGLAVSLQMERTHPLVVGTFIVTLALTAYVLFVPGNPIERNVGAKLEVFRDGDGGSELLVQRGTFNIQEYGPATVEFYQPFADVPKVEVLHYKPSNEQRPYVSTVTNVHVEFSRASYGGKTPNRFSWIARGKPMYSNKSA